MSFLESLRPKPLVTYLTPRQFTEAADGTDDPALRKEVDDAIAELQPKASEFSSSKAFSDTYLGLIGAAEEHVAKKEWAEAHQAVWQATFLVNRALETKGAGAQRTWIAAMALVWLVVLLFVGRCLWALDAAQPPTIFFGSLYWRYIFLGALGGVTIVVFGLIKHTVDLDFDTRYFAWYVFKPILGGLMGLVAVLVVLAGLVAIKKGSASPDHPALLYVLAFVAGFSERFSLRLLDKVVTAVLGGDSKQSTALPAPPKVTPEGSTGSGG